MMTILFLALRPKKRHATWSQQVREKFVTFFCKKNQKCGFRGQLGLRFDTDVCWAGYGIYVKIFLAALAALYLTLVSDSLSDRHFRISTQRVTFET